MTIPQTTHSGSPGKSDGCHIGALIPMAHVRSVQASIEFYAHLGFGCVSRLDGLDGRPFWAMLRSPRTATQGGAELMLAAADSAIDAGQQAVLFYMYTADVSAIRRRLLDAGLPDGGQYRGQALPSLAPGGDPIDYRVVYEIARPHYMPMGEVRVHDPDGYVLLVGQLGE